MKNLLKIWVATLFLLGCTENKKNKLYDYGDKEIQNVFTLDSSYDVKKYSYQKEKSKKPKNIILLIGDGMGLGQIQAALLANRGKLNMTNSEVIGFSKTLNVHGRITDSGAGGTALATGKKTYNGAISVDTNKINLKTLLHIANELGKSTGVVVSCEVTHATPATFLVNHENRKEYDNIAKKILESPFNFVYGGGKKRFNEDRKDGNSIIPLMKENNIKFITENSDLDSVKNLNNHKILAVLTDGHPEPYEHRGEFLMNGTVKALELLSKNEKGFFLMIEGSQIDWAGHRNKLPYMIEETLDFDRVVGNILEFAHQNGETLVIVTADHETGGFMTIDSKLEEGFVEGRFTSENHTEAMVPVMVTGPMSEIFTGVYENTEIFDKIILSIK